MSQSDDLVGRLVADADLTAAFAVRSSSVSPKDLLDALAAAKKKSPLLPSDAEFVALQIALNSALRGIDPVTLADLRGGWDPFSKPKTLSFGNAGQLIQRYIALTSAVLLIIITGYFTLKLDEAKNLIVHLQEIHDENPSAKLNQALRVLYSVKEKMSYKSSDPNDDIANDVYFALLDQVRENDKKLQIYTNLSIGFNASLFDPFEWFVDYVETPAAFNTDGQSASNPPEDPPLPLPTLQPNAVEAAPLIAGRPPEVARTDLQKLHPLNSPPTNAVAPCAFLDPNTIGQRTKQISDTLNQSLFGNQAILLEFVCTEQLVYSPLGMPPVINLIEETSMNARIVGSWLLPCLYGALGGLIFYMRTILNPLLPDPNFARILYRVALGALAGVVVSWFLQPATLSGAETTISLTALGVAFLIGFSIDVFFAVLERGVGVIRASVGPSISTSRP